MPITHKLLLTSLTLCALAARAFGQMGGPPPPIHVATIDLTMANSPTVVVGTLESYVDPKSKGAVQVEAFIKVAELLKGKPVRELKVWLEGTSAGLEMWKRESHRLLISMSTDPKKPASVIDLSDEQLAVLTADLKLLHRPDQVIQAAKAEVARTAGAPATKSYSLRMKPSQLTGNPVASQLRGGQQAYADVPVDQRVENWGRDQTKAKDPDDRIAGIQALSLFRSAANIGILQGLLDDPGWKDSYFGFAEKYKLLHTRTNYVRREAYKTLKALGESVPEPVSLTPKTHDEQVMYAEYFAADMTFQNLEELFKYPNLESVRLANGTISSQIFGVDARLRIRHVSLDNTGVTDGLLELLNAPPALEYLGLTDTNVTDAGLMKLAKFKGLKTVDVGTLVTPAGIAKFHEVRPDVVVRPDPFAFLAQFHPRRIDQPLEAFTQGFYTEGDPSGVREYALVIPQEYAAKLDDSLKKELFSRHWTHDYFGYAEPTPGQDRVFTEFHADWLLGVMAGPGDRILVIRRKVY